MTKEEAPRAIYQFHILLLKMSPAIWRRVLVASDQSLADFHSTIQIVMGWDDTHLHRFLIHGQAHGISREGGLPFHKSPEQIRPPQPIPHALAERVRHLQSGVMGHWPISNKSTITPLAILSVGSWKS